MTDLTRKPKPMTEKQIAQYLELDARLTVQTELIMSVFNPLNDREHVTKVEFEMGHPDEPQIYIWYHFDCYGVDCDNYFSCPESYLGMTEDELRAEEARLEEEERRKREERAAKAKAAKEKRKAEKRRRKLRRRPTKRTRDTGGILN